MIKYLVFLGSAWVQLSRTGKKWIPVFLYPVTYEGLRPHTHLKGLAMVPCAVFLDRAF